MSRAGPRVRVKVCGLRTSADLRAAAGADAVGFVVASPTSRRNLPPPRAAALAARAPPFAKTVLVTRETEPARLAALQGAVPTDALQVHGVRDAAHARAVRRAVRGPLLLAAAVDHAPGPAGARAAARMAVALAGHADAILLDTGQGGTGRVHDWAASAAAARALARRGVPAILAGGLTPANVAPAIAAVGPYAVDVSGGVEGSRGKSAARVAAFLAAARGA